MGGTGVLLKAILVLVLLYVIVTLIIGVATTGTLTLHYTISYAQSLVSLFTKGYAVANAIEYEGLSLRNVGETLVDDDASTSNMPEYLKSIPHVKASISNEARSPKQTDGAKEAPSVRVG